MYIRIFMITTILEESNFFLPSNSVMNLEVHNYVIFKYGDIWQEGRVLEVFSIPTSDDPERKSYRVLSFKTQSELPVQILDNIFPSTLDTARKFKIQPIYELCRGDYIPVELKKIIFDDLEKVEKNIFTNLISKMTVSMIIKDFSKYFTKNKGGTMPEEIDEMTKGFIHCFNSLACNNLLTEKEAIAYSNIEMPKGSNASDVMGGEYLLRMILFLERRILSKLRDLETRNIIFDYITYLLDFLKTHYNTYFGRGTYCI